MKSLWHPGYTSKHNLKYLLIDLKDVCLEIHHNRKYKVHQVEFISSSRGWSIYGRQLKTHPTKINTILDVICSEIDIARLGVLPKGVSEGEKRQSNTSTIYKSRCCLKPCFTSVSKVFLMFGEYMVKKIRMDMFNRCHCNGRYPCIHCLQNYPLLTKWKINCRSLDLQFPC